VPIGLREPAPAPAPDKMKGALLVAASLIAIIRLRGEPITPSPKVRAVISDSVTLAREILRELERR
jgi:hypothetical protein